MGLFDDLSDSLTSTINLVGKKAQNAGDITRLQYDKSVKEKELLKLYENLGKKYYEDNIDSEDDQIKVITATKLRIKEISEEIMSIKGGVACPKCGEIVKEGSLYCSACGERINDIFED